jgi:hypothetical protein
MSSGAPALSRYDADRLRVGAWLSRLTSVHPAEQFR